MNKYVIIVTGEGDPPEGLPELLPWAKRYGKIQVKDRELTKNELQIAVRRLLIAILGKP